jgi:hypothetical protein
MPITLQSIAESSLPISIHTLNEPEHVQAAHHLQRILCTSGILDPVISGGLETPFKPTGQSDGIIGLNTRNALHQFFRLRNLEWNNTLLTAAHAAALLEAERVEILPIKTKIRLRDSKQTRLAKRLVMYMQAKGYWIARAPGMVNIVYAEGMDADGDENTDKSNEWNDRRMVFRIRASHQPQMILNHAATTEPGAHYTKHPLNPNGAARVAFGQYKAWADGLHNGSQPALVQRGLIRLHRDRNKDGKRSPTDPMDVGTAFGINQHTTRPGFQSDQVDKYSAGCMVGRNYQEHLKFLATVRKDPRYQMNKSYLFVTTVIAGDDFGEVIGQ